MPIRSWLMPFYIGLVLLAALAACAGYPTRLAPVPQQLPARGDAIPADADYAARAIFATIQGAPLNGAYMPPEVADALDDDFDYPGFTVAEHTLYDSRERGDGPQGRFASGILRVADANGRAARIMYSATYTVGRGGLHIDAAQAAPVSVEHPRITAMLIPKDAMPQADELPQHWTGIYHTLSALNVMPEDGLTSLDQLSTHTLVVFVMDRLPAVAEVRMAFDLSDIVRLGKPLALSYDQYLDLGGWRIAVVQLRPQRTI